MRIRISGHSMYPAYRDGDVVEVDEHAYDVAPPSEGDVVVALHPFKADVHIVKRVRSVEPDGRLFLVGDSPLESSDSRGFGALDPARIVGKVIGKSDD